MKYRIETNDPKQLPNIEAALKIIDPSAELVHDPSGFRLVIDVQPSFRVKVIAPDLGEPNSKWEHFDEEILDKRYSQADRRQRLKELVRLGILKVLGGHFQKQPPWGILSGVRPAKIFHYLRDKGFSVSEIGQKLVNIYGLNPVKADLLLRIGSLQERFFKSPEYIGIYVGIPFCPTRCHYCSFPAVSLLTHSHLVKNYVKCLRQEIEAISDLCRERHLKVESIYIGGGTPTSLDEVSFTKVIEWVETGFKSEDTVEFTVEAGRPETISEQKLFAMQASGVNRISVNPQTMQEKTLALIGRAHTVAEVFDSVRAVKRIGSFKLNMDLIQGLPNETVGDFLDSLAKVAALEPENITVHTLSPKRAAQWGRQFSNLNIARDEELAAVNEQTIGILRDEGYEPYYLYRQRRILADLENIGYAKPGAASIYNIQMMEERQTIFGIGAGAVTKWVNGADHHLVRYQNPKCPATYCRRLAEDIVKKAQQTRLLLG